MKPLSLALQCGQDEYRWSSSWKRNYTLEDYHLATKGLESGLVLFSKKDSQEVTQQCACVCVCAWTPTSPRVLGRAVSVQKLLLLLHRTCVQFPASTAGNS